MIGPKSLLASLAGVVAMLALAVAPALATTVVPPTTVTYSVSNPGSPATSYGSVTVTSPGDYGYGLPGTLACPTTTTQDTVTISGVTSNEIVTGQIVVYFATTGGPVTIETIPVNGNGTYTVTYPASSQWLSDDIHADVQLGAVDATTGATLTVAPPFGSGNAWDVFGPCMQPPPTVAIGAGMTATIGFWHNKNGQAVINSLNGGPTSTALSTWLATQFPNLYGCLNGETNAQIAALFLKDFSVTGAKTDAQVLATALAVYSTSTTLSGSTLPARYGFATSPSGTGSATYNVGSYGAAVGVANNTTLTIMQILQGVNAQSSGCTLDGGNATLLGLTNSLFDGINQTGDIAG